MRRIVIGVIYLLALGLFGLVIPNALISAAVETGIIVAGATEQTETFAISNRTCPLCPVTVRTAMERVPGVKSVHVDFNAKTATVVFDPSAATAEAIGKASTNAGYPAAPVGQHS